MTFNIFSTDEQACSNYIFELKKRKDYRINDEHIITEGEDDSRTLKLEAEIKILREKVHELESTVCQIREAIKPNILTSVCFFLDS